MLAFAARDMFFAGRRTPRYSYTSGLNSEREEHGLSVNVSSYPSIVTICAGVLVGHDAHNVDENVILIYGKDWRVRDRGG